MRYRRLCRLCRLLSVVSLKLISITIGSVRPFSFLPIYIAKAKERRTVLSLSKSLQSLQSLRYPAASPKLPLLPSLPRLPRVSHKKMLKRRCYLLSISSAYRAYRAYSIPHPGTKKLHRHAQELLARLRDLVQPPQHAAHFLRVGHVPHVRIGVVDVLIQCL